MRGRFYRFCSDCRRYVLSPSAKSLHRRKGHVLVATGYAKGVHTINTLGRPRKLSF